MLSGKHCSSRSGLLGRHACATLEFMPLEHWHVRHFKGGGLAYGLANQTGNDGPCRKSGAVSSVLATNGKRQRVLSTPEEDSFPSAWLVEYKEVLDRVTHAVLATSARDITHTV